MFAHLSYKKKLKYLGIIVIPVLFLCYELSFKKAIEEYKRYERTAERGGGMIAIKSVSILAARQARVEGLYNRYVLDTFSVDKNLLAIASNFCRSNGLTLKEYRTVSLATSDSIQVLTRLLTVEGRFIPGVQLIYELETKRRAGRVSSAVFASFVEHRDKSTRLDCTLYIQNLIP